MPPAIKEDCELVCVKEAVLLAMLVHKDDGDEPLAFAAADNFLNLIHRDG